MLFGDIDQCKKIAAKTDVHRLGDIERSSSRDRRVNGVSALHQDPQPRLRRKRLAGGHHAVARNDGRAGLFQPPFCTIAAHGIVRGPG